MTNLLYGLDVVPFMPTLVLLIRKIQNVLLLKNWGQQKVARNSPVQCFFGEGTNNLSFMQKRKTVKHVRLYT